MVLCPNALKWIEGGQVKTENFLEPVSSIEAVVEAALSRYATHIWIHPETGTFNEPRSHDAYTFDYHTRNRKTAGISAWKRNTGGRKVTIIFPENTAWAGEGGWLHNATAYEILVVIHYLEQVLGVPVGMSPGRVGWNYLKTLHPEWVEEVPGVDLRAAHFSKEVARDLIWQRLLTFVEQGKAFIHKFDKSAAYPYASTQTDIGAGTPVLLTGNDAAIAAVHEKGHQQEVGVWRCSIRYNAASYDPAMPPVWLEHKGTYAGAEGWLAGPIIRLLRSQGHTVDIHEGYVFPDKHDVLVQWANNLWTFRQRFNTPGAFKNEHCATLAGRAMKQIMNHAVGMTGSGKLADDDEMKRPDIRIQVITRHRELTWHNINKVKQLYGVTPVLVYMDAAYYISNEPDGRNLFPELMKRTGKFGGYRWEGRIALEPDVLAILADTSNAGRTLELLNKRGWQK